MTQKFFEWRVNCSDQHANTGGAQKYCSVPKGEKTTASHWRSVPSLHMSAMSVRETRRAVETWVQL